jgi:hypothetical protein
MEQSKSGLYIVAIVGIIAIAALVIMIMDGNKEKLSVSSVTNAIQDPTGLATGVAYSDTTCIYEDNSETIGCPCSNTNLWNSELMLDLC